MVECNYDSPNALFKRNLVYGRLCTLFKVKDKKHMTAISELAIKSLSSVVIENPKVG
jgi:chromosome segregation ATPase